MTKTIEDVKEEIQNLKDAIKALEDGDDTDAYDEMLKDCYGEIDICGYKYDAASVLKEVDPTAYRCGLVDYNDSQLTGFNDDLAILEEELKELEEVTE